MIIKATLDSITSSLIKHQITTLDELKKLITENGFKLDDIRLNLKTIDEKIKLNKDDEQAIINSELQTNMLLKNILKGNLTISNWSVLVDNIKKIYDIIKENETGHVADYIPQLAKVNPNLLCISVVTVDGQVLELGNTDSYFSVQSCSKPITYAIAVEGSSEEYVHNFIGREPSGRNFNELCLNSENIPHNPLINSGAIMAASLVKYKDSQADRFEHVMNYWEKLIGEKINFSNPVYLSEKATAARNHCLAWMMQEKGAFQHGKNVDHTREWSGEQDLDKNLELYFQLCSIECNCRQMALLASTLANGGVNVFSGEPILQQENVKNVLSLMNSCGLYDYSGEWSYLIGIPAKSGVSGIIYAVIPDVMSIAVYSPKLDHIGNSARGVQFFKEFGKIYSTHAFDNASNAKQALTKREHYSKGSNVYNLLKACSIGDISEVRKLIAQGVDVNSSDYDNRTALHLACSTGNADVVDYLLKSGAYTNVKDRWNNKPYDDAKQNGHDTIINLLDTAEIVAIGW